MRAVRLPVRINALRVNGLSQSQLTQIAAERAKEAAEEYFKMGDITMAIKQGIAAHDLNPESLIIKKHVAAYVIHKMDSMKMEIDRTKLLYSILLLEVGSSLAEIREHYKELTLWLHPDKNDSVAAEGAFKILHHAYKTLLSDHNKKRKA